MPFFDRIEIENFRCLRSVAFDLAPFTVFVGANGSGKSSILLALAPQSMQWQNASIGTTGETSVTYWRDGSSAVNRVKRPATGATLAAKPSHVLLQLTLAALRQSNLVAQATRLDQGGQNLPNALASFGRRKLEMLAEQFCNLVPIYQDVDVRPRAQGHQAVVFQDRWHPETWYGPEQVSDGSLIMLALLAACHQADAPDILAIDELERGLHPYLLQRVVDLCRRLAAGEFGRPVQVVAATHSPTLLDFLEPAEVRFVSRNPNDGGSVVTAPPTEAPEWQRTYDAYRDSLGDIWLSGALGGVVGR